MSIVSSKSDLISQEYSRLGKVLGIETLSVDLRTIDTTNRTFINLDKMMEETPIEKKYWLHRDLNDLEEWFAVGKTKKVVFTSEDVNEEIGWKWEKLIGANVIE